MGNRTFRYFNCQFATWTFRYHLRRFASGRQRSSYSIANYKLSDRWRNVQRDSEKSWYWNVQRCKTSRWRTGKVAKRPWIDLWMDGVLGGRQWFFWRRCCCCKFTDTLVRLWNCNWGADTSGLVCTQNVSTKSQTDRVQILHDCTLSGKIAPFYFLQ